MISAPNFMVINPTFVNMLLKTKNFNVMVVMLHAVGGYVCWIVGFDTAQCWKGFGGECSTVWLYLKYTDFVMTLLWEYTVPRLLPQTIIARCITRVTAVGVFSAGTQACSQGKLGSARFASWGDYYEIKHLQVGPWYSAGKWFVAPFRLGLSFYLDFLSLSDVHKW